MNIIDQINNKLEELIQNVDNRNEWLNSPNKELNELSPQQLIDKGQDHVVLDYIEDIENGALQ